MAPDQTALAQFLQGDMPEAIELQPRNPQLPLYLAIAEATADRLALLPVDTALPEPLLTLIRSRSGSCIGCGLT